MQNIVLVGFMGTGKTAVGRILAAKLGCEFIEMDEMIEAKEGCPVREIFDKKGEDYFRNLEMDTAGKVSQEKGVIISTGGGAVVNDKNFQNFKKNGLIICLEASPKVILKRTKDLASRPLLNVPDPEKKIEELLKKRAPYYKRADFCIDTDTSSAEEVADKIIKWVTKRD
ncbi:MAG: shikimate kinase [Candidatus Omnitrophica bacterium]|nr:shikimate kinase [Candidatus Omnitrophota bacterium]MBU4148734.1 shikimate kinase [Candidatus Omnitrophota bacterium]